MRATGIPGGSLLASLSELVPGGASPPHITASPASPSGPDAPDRHKQLTSGPPLSPENESSLRRSCCYSGMSVRSTARLFGDMRGRIGSSSGGWPRMRARGCTALPAGADPSTVPVSGAWK
ncbi:unnamed protein product [Gadus morhua 'NCC']